MINFPYSLWHLIRMCSRTRAVESKLNSEMNPFNMTSNSSMYGIKKCSQQNETVSMHSSLCTTLQIVMSMNSRAPLVSRILSIALNSLTSIFATVTNILIITVLLKKQVLRNAANLILTSMAVSDLMVGISVQPFTIVYMTYEILQLNSCTVKSITSYLGALCVAGSLVNTCFFALDRCFATLLPYFYLDDVIYNKYLLAIVVAWLVLILVVITTYARIVGEAILQNLLKWLFFISFILIFVSYVIIYYAVRAQKKKIKSLAPSRRRRYIKEDFQMRDKVVSNASSSIGIGTVLSDKIDTSRSETIPFSLFRWKASYNVEKKEVEDNKKMNRTSDSNIKRQRSTSFTVVVILSVLLVCYLPLTILNAVNNVMEIEQVPLQVAYCWANFFVLLNSSLNPIIYCIRVTSIRLEVTKLLRGLTH